MRELLEMFGNVGCVSVVFSCSDRVSPSVSLIPSPALSAGSTLKCNSKHFCHPQTDIRCHSGGKNRPFFQLTFFFMWNITMTPELRVSKHMLGERKDTFRCEADLKKSCSHMSKSKYVWHHFRADGKRRKTHAWDFYGFLFVFICSEFWQTRQSEMNLMFQRVQNNAFITKKRQTKKNMFLQCIFWMGSAVMNSEISDVWRPLLCLGSPQVIFWPAQICGFRWQDQN